MLECLQCLAKTLEILANHLKPAKPLGGLACLACFSYFFIFANFQQIVFWHVEIECQIIFKFGKELAMISLHGMLKICDAFEFNKLPLGTYFQSKSHL